MGDPKTPCKLKQFIKSNPFRHGFKKAAFILGIIASIITIIGVFYNCQSKRENPNNERNKELLVEKIEFSFIQIDNESNELERKHLITETSKTLEELIKLDSNYAVSFFLFAELYLKNNDPIRTIDYLDKAKELKYTPAFDINVAYGLAHRMLGNQNKSKKEFSQALFNYEEAKDFFSHAINDTYDVFRDVHIPSKYKAEVELEIKVCKAELLYLKTFDPDFTGRIDSNITDIEISARYFYDNFNHIKAARCYYWLLKQKLNQTRLKPIKASFEHVSVFWEYPPNDEYDILYDIDNNYVCGIINNVSAKFLEKPYENANKIRQIGINEVFEIIGRSDSRQLVDGVNAYWYEVRAEDDTIGWIYGKYLWVFPNSIEWKYKS